MSDRKTALSGRSSFYRYIYFLITSFRLTRYSSWKRRGEPNPFVPVVARQRHTHRQEILDIFEDAL